MANWTTIPSSVLAIGKPTRSIDITALNDNVTAVMEKAAGAPVLANSYVVEAMLGASAVAQAKIKSTPLIPHPFKFNDAAFMLGKTVVLLDPVGGLAEKLHALHLSGESVSEMLHGDYLSIGNVPLAAVAPPGVMPVAVAWR
jgi:hypothetical protein